MTIDLTAVVGNVAAFLTTFSFLPQAIKTIRSKNTRHLSLPMYLIFVSGVSLWIWYGIANEQTPIIAGNAITLLLAGTILWYKLKEKN